MATSWNLSASKDDSLVRVWMLTVGSTRDRDHDTIAASR